jgi:hypothetical protein
MPRQQRDVAAALAQRRDAQARHPARVLRIQPRRAGTNCAESLDIAEPDIANPRLSIGILCQIDITQVTITPCLALDIF